MNKLKNNLIGVSGKKGAGKDLIFNIIQYLTSDYSSRKFDPNFNYISSSFINKKYADKLKDMVCMLIGCTREQLEDREFKEKELSPEWWRYKVHDGSVFRFVTKSEYRTSPKSDKFIIKPTPRKILQILGTEAGRDLIHPNIWMNSLFADYYPKREKVLIDDSEEYIDKYPNWVVTDVRFPNEVKAIEDRGGIVIRVDRELPISIANNKETVKDVIKTIDHRGNDDFVYKDQKGIIYRKSDWSEVKEHESEVALDDYNFNYRIINDGSITDLIEKVQEILK